jgi:hypothetical protein
MEPFFVTKSKLLKKNTGHQQNKTSGGLKGTWFEYESGYQLS